MERSFQMAGKMVDAVMLKRNLILLLLVLLAGSGAAACSHDKDGQAAGGGQEIIQNHIGDLRYKSRDFEEVAVPGYAAVAQSESRVSSPGAGPASGNPSNPGKEPNAGVEGGEAGGAARQQPSSEGSGSLRVQIEQKYLARLQSLASGYEARLNGLILSALNESRAARKENPGADLMPIMKRYYMAGKELEAECDFQFYSVLSEFESELKANSFPTDAADGARDTYEARKSAKMGEMKYN